MCKLIDLSLIVPHLRVTIENLFQTANQAIYIGGNHPMSDQLIGCMVRRLHCYIEDLCWIVKEIEPGKVNTGCLTLEESLTLEGYAEIRRGLVKSWEFIDAREQTIINRQ